MTGKNFGADKWLPQGFWGDVSRFKLAWESGKREGRADVWRLDGDGGRRPDRGEVGL